MSRLEELERQLADLTALLKERGITQPVRSLPATERADYIAHGSAEHAAFLGLVEVGKDDTALCIATFTSPRTGRTFRLEDELSALRYYPHLDPEKAIPLVIQQKVNELETKPEVPDDAPPMFQPVAVYPG